MPGAQIIELLLSWGVTTALTFLVVIVDERRLSEERLERAWPSSSRDAAIMYFGLLAVPLHFARTRGNFKSGRGVLGLLLGLLLGVALAALVVVVSSLLITGIAWACGLPLAE